MDILDSKYRDRSIFHLDLSDRQLTVDNVNIGLFHKNILKVQTDKVIL